MFGKGVLREKTSELNLKGREKLQLTEQKHRGNHKLLHPKMMKNILQDSGAP